ncbi:hypothetical protein [Nocardioides coralli]|uniref:hypothetical protein n=1 Tax=Nocardioides coralli TaxID=2872154 RepID=UPI001CA4640E|nr:hypothetical protein [Nocardioides coralli]QZY28958.1 hypothetical protein K6T13_16205 [Nocardioides coralli]
MAIRSRRRDADERDRPRKRVWVEHVDPELAALRIQLAALRTRRLDPAQEEIAQGVQELLERAQNAVDRRDPAPYYVLNWWRGTLVEAAFRNLHAARALIVELYDEVELEAEIDRAVARLNARLHRNDPRRLALRGMDRERPEVQRAFLRRLIEDTYDASDLQHAQLREFRNILLSAAFVVSALLGVAVFVIARNPSFVPLCFPAMDIPPDTEARLLNCPTAARTPSPRSADVLIVGLLGLLGGALATSIAIRKVSRASSLSYDVPVALAWLKVPLGAFVAILGLLAIQGGFVPGLSRLDTQQQILAYALLFGFAQQLLTSTLDSKAKSLVEDLPLKDESTARGEFDLSRPPEPALPGEETSARRDDGS